MLWLLAGFGSASAVVFVSPEINTTPTPDNFSICFDNSCQSIRQLALPDHRWHEIRDIFRAGAHSPEEERRLIGQAVARLERIIGGMTGTANDKGANETSDNPLDHRMDCIDESTNTTSYLYLLQQDGLLRWHRLRDPVTRGFFFFGWPHTTAVIEAREERRLWAVDSWFHDNGIAPEILPLEQWKQGWRPDPP
ncbi:hypothetical protein [Sedimenticola hydrogenitrophicus]|uniref:hypothetical protein n=1 Tax=Sedimenticola hydrogenitrophicus TaxID=2967975 RepID=UPI0021A8256E|nr:hypothetical protein [Sedimenticola hydrogenitrophicus]